MDAGAGTRILRRPLAALLLVLAAGWAPGRAAERTGSPDSVVVPSARFRLEATASIGWTIHEQVENGLRQAGSEDAADEVASGFNFRQGRLGLAFASDGGAFQGLLRLRLEERTDIIDFWGLYRATRMVSIVAGQMKVPSTAEVLVPDERLDFITRTQFGRLAGDYALARTPYISPFMAVKSYDRDLGLSVRVGWPQTSPRFSGFLMVSNGLGGNRSIGGRDSPELLFTNGLGEYYYGARLELRPLARPVAPGPSGSLDGSTPQGGPQQHSGDAPRIPEESGVAHAPGQETLSGTSWRWIEDLILGVHGSVNRHEDVALSSRGPVADFDRTIWSADLAASLSWGQRVRGFVGSGEIDDDWGGIRYRFGYSGWGLWTLWAPGGGALELGLRHDEFKSEYRQVEDPVRQRHWTFGLNWQPHPPLRLQLNYLAKETDSGTDPDLADDILFLNLQFSFGAGLMKP